jgi:hypothetical protein
MGDNVLIAKEGYVYTNGEAFGNKVELGIYDSADNWLEITEEEYQALKALADISEEATEEDYKNALDELGVNTNE